MKKVLIFDIETFANLAYVWGKYEQNVLSYVREGGLASFAYKWYGERNVKAFSLPDFPRYKKDKFCDRELAQKLHELFCEADYIVAHNGQRFDIKKANAAFIHHGLTPPHKYKVIDTKVQAKSHFMFNSNKLDDLGNFFGLGRKLHTGGFDLWLGCMAGDMKAWKKMVRYNKQDVVLLEKVFVKLLPWIDRVNFNEPDPSQGCPTCGSTNYVKKGKEMTASGEYQAFQCRNCGHRFRGTEIINTYAFR